MKFKDAYKNSSLFEEIDSDQLYYEQRQIWYNAKFEHYRYFSAAPNYKGKYISTNNRGFRNTVQYLKDSNLPLKNVAVFGTSTMWGGPSGGDEFTVPSLLAKKLNEYFPDINFLVNNFAVGSYNSVQELILFIELIENESIDIALFVDGASEFLKSYDELRTNKPRGYLLSPDLRYLQFSLFNSYVLPRYYSLPLRIKRSLFGSFVRNSFGFVKSVFKHKRNSVLSDQEIIKSQINRSVNLYLKNKKIIEVISKKFEIKSMFFLEPWLFTKQNLSDEEEKILQQLGNDKVYLDFLENTVTTFKELFSSEENCYDLTDVFDVSDTIFIDEHHMSRKGNEIIAEKISQIIMSNLN